MGETTAVVLVVLIIAAMVVGALVVLVFGAVKALEVRRGTPRPAPRPHEPTTAAAHHPMFDQHREQR